MIKKIVSGGQTGADRAALDAAIEAGIETGGFVPRGLMAEDGPIPDRYPGLIETGTGDPAERTRLNVINSDGTLVFTHGKVLGGTALTVKYAGEHLKPCLHIDFLNAGLPDTGLVKEWLSSNHIEVLNIAGPRDSEDPFIYERTFKLLSALFGWS